MFNKIVNYLDLIVSKFWLFFCSMILIGAIFVKAQYNFADFPYFTWNYSYDIFLYICVFVGYIVLFKKREWIESKIPYPVLWIGFGLIGVIYVYLVPIKPFSDMTYVTEGAIYFASGDIEGILASEYLQVITKNLKVSMFYGFLGMLLPKSMFSMRIINVILYLLIAHFMGLIAKNYKFKYQKFVFIITASFVPLLLYCNHIYYDLPVLCMCTIAVYFYTKEKNIKNMVLAGLALGVACSLRVLAYLFLIAMIMDFVFIFKKDLLLEKGKKAIILLCFVSIVLFLPKACDEVVNTSFRIEGAEDESIWTLFWMGINEEEFGFMHNEIADGKKSFSDFVETLTSRDFEQNIKLFGRKLFWEWSQGTYQAQRYAFSLDANNWSEKFEYETPITRYLMHDSQVTRQFINSFMREQYLALFSLMLIALYNLKEDGRKTYRMFIYLMFGTFLVLVFYEMKSRYVAHCLLPMILFALKGLQHIEYRQQKFLKARYKNESD